MPIRDFTTGKTKFVQMIINSPDGRFPGKPFKGGLDKRTIIFEAKKYPQDMIVDLFDNIESQNDADLSRPQTLQRNARKR